MLFPFLAFLKLQPIIWWKVCHVIAFYLFIFSWPTLYLFIYHKIQITIKLSLLIHFPCIALSIHCTLYLDFFDVLAATVVFPVSAGLFEPAWSFSLNDETCITDTCNDTILCKVTGKRVHSKGPRGGLAIPCKLRWTSSNKKHVWRLDKLIATEKSKILQRYGLV